jgi:thioredoxin-like negative regulator of GroEL
VFVHSVMGMGMGMAVMVVMMVMVCAVRMVQCKMIAPEVERLSEEHSDLVFLKVDVDDAADSARNAGVQSMPTFMFVKSGELISKFSGANVNQLKDSIEQLKKAK